MRFCALKTSIWLVCEKKSPIAPNAIPAASAVNPPHEHEQRGRKMGLRVREMALLLNRGLDMPLSRLATLAIPALMTLNF